MKRYRCGVCKKELTKEEVKNYLEVTGGLTFNWGTCDGEEATLEEINITLSDHIIFNGLNAEEIEEYNWRKEDHAVIQRSNVKQFIKDLKREMYLTLENSDIIDRLAGDELVK